MISPRRSPRLEEALPAATGRKISLAVEIENRNIKEDAMITMNATKPYLVRVIDAVTWQPTGQIFYVDSVDEFYDPDAECNQIRRGMLRIEPNPGFKQEPARLN